MSIKIRHSTLVDYFLGLTLWLDGSDYSTITLNGSNISQWDDKSGNGNHATQTTQINQPLYVSNGLNNQGIAKFEDGESHYFNFPTAVFQGLTEFTTFMVIKKDKDAFWQRYYDAGVDVTKYMFLCPQGGGAPSTARYAITITGGGGEKRVNWPTISTASYHLLTVSLKSTLAQVWQDTVSQASINPGLTPASLGTLTYSYIGKSIYGADPYLVGSLAEFIVYDRFLENSERTFIETYLNNKWGL